MKLSLNINNRPGTVDVDGDMPLLWVIRDVLDLKGTKFGCGKAACGACTILVDGDAVRSCSYPAKMAEGKQITTIEGLGTSESPHPVQQAWIEEIVPQCGYCQPGFMMATAALLNKHPNPSDDDIDQNIVNVCRCGTYYRMRKAIKKAAQIQAGSTIQS
ncbi:MULTISPECIES: (2Fe-2S)-binding protein [unclassified Imperialibacter]|uniref:(2Fe-2S)-binding protein n=1 Tax=unclassified Imperialibacter TaxID=2629706 RepID=UPI00125B9E61|nr:MULTISPECIES: (2Fe-2S)-binding protein [unclassified Imperialibacter]CAD5277647.1 Nicotinate dehydrogenase subunit A [Imperialibacter sp. 75]CAD5295515.1 Nicotinate dehydrogenase subunit A [Imperialibacter sp. 89]VVT11990.1 Nicotinate dehydrogenase subunit A [Imperialibacter sp. EC-SDR9]